MLADSFNSCGVVDFNYESSLVSTLLLNGQPDFTLVISRIFLTSRVGTAFDLVCLPRPKLSPSLRRATG